MSELNQLQSICMVRLVSVKHIAAIYILYCHKEYTPPTVDPNEHINLN